MATPTAPQATTTGVIRRSASPPPGGAGGGKNLDKWKDIRTFFDGQDHKTIKILEIALTLFYGQLLASALYDNFCRGIPDLIVDHTSFFSIFKVGLGIFIIALTVFSLISIWKKFYKLIFISGILLSLVFLLTIVINVVDLIHYNENYKGCEGHAKTNHTRRFMSLVAETIIESLFRILAIAATFALVKFIRNFYYTKVKTNDPKLDNDF